MIKFIKTKETALIVGGIILFIAGLVLVNGRPSSAESAWCAAVYATRPEGNELIAAIPLSEGMERIVDVSGPLGVTTIEIIDTGVHVSSSPCPDHLCIKFGWLHAEPDFAACLPNEVLVVVQKPADVSQGPFGSWD